MNDLLLSTAYFPPADYFSLMAINPRVIIERHENYHRQTYRNRCIISGANGPLTLVVPVLRGSFHKTAIKELRIDNSRRWRDVHQRGIESAYAQAPYFEYYYDLIKDVIIKPFDYLLDLNSAAIAAVCEATGISPEISFSEAFEPSAIHETDYRYSITPKKPSSVPGYREIHYTQVFSDRHGFQSRMSIIDTIFNKGPGTRALLLRSLGR